MAARGSPCRRRTFNLFAISRQVTLQLSMMRSRTRPAGHGFAALVGPYMSDIGARGGCAWARVSVFLSCALHRGSDPKGRRARIAWRPETDGRARASHGVSHRVTTHRKHSLGPKCGHVSTVRGPGPNPRPLDYSGIASTWRLATVKPHLGEIHLAGLLQDGEAQLAARRQAHALSNRTYILFISHWRPVTPRALSRVKHDDSDRVSHRTPRDQGFARRRTEGFHEALQPERSNILIFLCISGSSGSLRDSVEEHVEKFNGPSLGGLDILRASDGHDVELSCLLPPLTL